MSADVCEKYVLKQETMVYSCCDGNLSFSASSNHDEDYNSTKKKISRDMVTHSVTMLEKHLVYQGETPTRNFTTNRVKKRSMKPEDPMSHRIIEKRRRDRMNNCLADLSRLIPPEYLKKGRGRIEKTEIIEMAIKHMRHLQSIIASARFNVAENSDSSVPSPPATSTGSKDTSAYVADQPIIVEHYRLGYLECLSEAMHFLVEVQGYFAGDSLCVQMINHLHKHCDKILKGNTLNLPKKLSSKEVGGSESSTSPANGTYHDCLPLGLSLSVGSPSDDNQPSQNFESVKHYDNSRNFPSEHMSPKKYQDSTHSKRPSESCCLKYQDPDGNEIETRSDSDLKQNFLTKCKNNEFRKDDSKSYFESGYRNYSLHSEHFLVVENGTCFESVEVKEENGNGPSQLREMLTSPPSVSNQSTPHLHKESKGSSSPTYPSGCEPNLGIKSSAPKTLCYKTQDGNEESNEFSEGSHPDNHHMMYKFKNNIKQRFSKEKECEFNCEIPLKKPKATEDFLKYPDPLLKERLNLLDRTDAEDENVLRDVQIKKRIRYGSESETQDGSDISNRLSFGHRSNEKSRRWEEPLPHGGTPKLWTFSPNVPGSLMTTHPEPPVTKPPGKHLPDFHAPLSNAFHSISFSASDVTPGIPIFALHAKGSFYVPLTLDQTTLAPFLTLLGITKTDEKTQDRTVLHPVTISVNFQTHLVR